MLFEFKFRLMVAFCFMACSVFFFSFLFAYLSKNLKDHGIYPRLIKKSDTAASVAQQLIVSWNACIPY